MNVKTLEFKNLFGHMSKKIEFNEDLTLLVGINGSGKTSVLKLLNWILNLNFEALVVTEFESIMLDFVFMGIEHKIHCYFKTTYFHYELSSSEKKYTPLTYNLKTLPEEIHSNRELKLEIAERLSKIGPDAEEQETWERIASFPKPTLIGLERTLFIENKEISYIETNFGIKSKKPKMRSPIDIVMELIENEYKSIKNEVAVLTNQLKNYLMLSAFENSVITLDSLDPKTSAKLSITQVQDVELKLFRFLDEEDDKTFSEEEKGSITNYFSQIKRIINNYNSDPENFDLGLIYSLNSNQFLKIIALLEQFERIERISNNKRLRITTFLNVINNLFNDSSKQVYFNQSTYTLSFSTLDRNKNLTSKNIDINLLSSGEQQIIILFAQIAFNSQNGKIFIIDEPELSLHLRWQEDFMTNLSLLTPKSTQVIIATHSPIFANHKRDKVKVLLPYN